MTTTDVVAPPGATQFLALTNDLDEVVSFIHENLDGQDITPRDLPRLTVPSGKANTYRWDVPTLEGSEAVEAVSGIIIFKTRGRAWWPGKPEETGGNTPPSCSSADAVTGVGKQWATIENPDPDDAQPRAIPCAQCPHSQFGSDGRGQACKETLQVFLLREIGFLPTVISIPPTSLAGMKKYLLNLSNNGLRFDQVITTLALDKTQNAGGTDYALVVPRLGGRLEPEQAAKAKAYGLALKPQLESVAQVTATLIDISAPVTSEAVEEAAAPPPVDSVIAHTTAPPAGGEQLPGSGALPPVNYPPAAAQEPLAPAPPAATAPSRSQD